MGSAPLKYTCCWTGEEEAAGRKERGRSSGQCGGKKKEEYLPNSTEHLCLSTALWSICHFSSAGTVGVHIGPLPSKSLLLDCEGHYAPPLSLHHRPQHLLVSPNSIYMEIRCDVAVCVWRSGRTVQAVASTTGQAAPLLTG